MFEITSIAKLARTAYLAGFPRHAHTFTDPEAIAAWNTAYDAARASLATKVIAHALPLVQRTAAQGQRVEQGQVSSC